MGKIKYVYRHGKRIAVEELNPIKTPKRKQSFKVEWFKFPAWWIGALRKASPGAYQLALIILAESFKRKYLKGDIVLSTEVTAMARSTKRRAVKELAELGLIAAEQTGNHAPIVTAVHYKRRAM